MDRGIPLILGLIAGSYIAAKAGGELRVRVPDARQASRPVVGGIPSPAAPLSSSPPSLELAPAPRETTVK